MCTFILDLAAYKLPILLVDTVCLQMMLCCLGPKGVGRCIVSESIVLSPSQCSS